MKPTQIIPGLIILAASAALTALFIWAVQRNGWVLVVIFTSSFLVASLFTLRMKRR